MRCIRCKGEMDEGVITVQRGIKWVSKKDYGGFLGKLTMARDGNIVGYKCRNCGNLDLFVK